MDKHPRKSTDIDTGWAWVALLSGFLMYALGSTALSMAGIIYIALLDRYGEGKSKTAMAGALANGLLCSLSPVATMFTNRFGSRVITLAGSILAASGYFISAFVDSLDGLIITTGVLVGIGSAFSFTGMMVNIGFYFKRWQKVAMALLFWAVPFGLMTATPLGMLILDNYGLQSAYLIMAGIVLQISVCACVCQPSSIERQLLLKRRINRSKSKRQFFNYKIFYNLDLMTFLIGNFSWSFAYGIGINHLPNYIYIKGGNAGTIATVFTVFSVANGIGRGVGMVITGIKGLNPLTAHIVSIGLCGLGTLGFYYYAGLPFGAECFAAQLGFLMGIPNCTMMAVAVGFVETAMLSDAIGLVYFSSGFGVFLGPYVAGFLFDVSNSYEYSFLATGTVLIAGSLLGVFTYCHSRHREPIQLTNIEVKPSDKLDNEAAERLTGDEKRREST